MTPLSQTHTPAQQQSCPIYFLNRSTIHPPVSSCGLHSGPIQHHLPPEPSQPLPGLLALASALSLSPLSHRRPKGACPDTGVRSHKSQSPKSSPAHMGLLSHTGFLAAPPVNISDMLQPQGLCAGCALCLEYSPRYPHCSLPSFKSLLKCVLSKMTSDLQSTSHFPLHHPP